MNIFSGLVSLNNSFYCMLKAKTDKYDRIIAGVINRTIGDITDFSSGAPCLTSQVVRVGDAFNSRGSIFEVFINVLQPTAIDVLVSSVKRGHCFIFFRF